jgi:hypothetical protein
MASKKDEHIKPKEAAGWAGIALVGFLGYKVYQWWISDDEDDKLFAERLARFGEYRYYSTNPGMLDIAKQWQVDNNKKLPSKGSADILMGPDTGNPSRGMRIVDDIWNSKGFWGDAESKAYKAIRGLNCVCEMWRIQSYWVSRAKNHPGNFWDYIAGFTNDDEKVNIVMIMDSKPWYYKGTYGADGDLEKRKKKLKLKEKTKNLPGK